MVAAAMNGARISMPTPTSVGHRAARTACENAQPRALSASNPSRRSASPTASGQFPVCRGDWAHRLDCGKARADFGTYFRLQPPRINGHPAVQRVKQHVVVMKVTMKESQVRLRVAQLRKDPLRAVNHADRHQVVTGVPILLNSGINSRTDLMPCMAGRTRNILAITSAMISVASSSLPLIEWVDRSLPGSSLSSNTTPSRNSSARTRPLPSNAARISPLRHSSPFVAHDLEDYACWSWRVPDAINDVSVFLTASTITPHSWACSSRRAEAGRAVIEEASHPRQNHSRQSMLIASRSGRPQCTRDKRRRGKLAQRLGIFCTSRLICSDRENR